MSARALLHAARDANGAASAIANVGGFAPTFGAALHFAVVVRAVVL